MSTQTVRIPAQSPSPQPSRAKLEIVKSTRIAPALTTLRVAFWTLGLLLAGAQAWANRFLTSTDSIAYLDMSDGVMPGSNWHRLINGTWSPGYPFLVGIFRRVFDIQPRNEIVAVHLLNVAFFVLAFICFEFFLAPLLRKARTSGPSNGSFAVPQWVLACVAYSLFIWGSIAGISLNFLRPDMLMSCFLYLAAAMLLNLSGREARWKDYLLLGVLLGVGFLAKAPMLPISVLVLGASLFVVTNWRTALKMAVAAGAIILVIGSTYFVPLSIAKKKFTLGESGAYNYLMHVTRPKLVSWYPTNPANGPAILKHSATQIFSSPPTFAFGIGPFSTYPLRYEPSWWLEGIKAKFSLSRQLRAAYANYVDLRRSARPLVPLVAALILLAFFVPRKKAFEAARWIWPVALIGVAGCAMYLAVHVESRYTSAFLVLFFCAVLGEYREVTRRTVRTIVAVAAPVIIVLLLLPLVTRTFSAYRAAAKSPNEDAAAVAELQTLGVRPGDQVGRISSILTDYGIERIAQVEIATEVDLTHVNDFWSAPVGTQNDVLQAMAAHGAKAVIATQPTFSETNQSEWKHLAASNYWVWLPSPAQSVAQKSKL